MKYNLHKKFRYELDWSEQDFQNAELEYFEHLKKINFAKNLDLLKYFGNSFFHDASIENVIIDSKKISLKIYLRRDDDLEDLDSFLEDQNSSNIRWGEYDKTPSLYKCTFWDVNLETENFKGLVGNTVIDSEIDQENNKFILRLSFENGHLSSFTCNSFEIEHDWGIAKKYLKESLELFPYCSYCQEKLLTPEKLAKRIEVLKGNA